MEKISNNNNNQIPLNAPMFPIIQLASGNINQISGEKENAILKIKINKNIPTDFIIVNSNFSINYLTIDPATSNITNLGTYREHESRVNDVCFFTNTNSPFNKSFISGDSNGNILFWDSRANKSSAKLSTHGKGEIFSLDTNPSFLAAGYGHEISIWDLKTLKQRGKCSYAHTEAVTCVKFYENFLMSSSEDNIINIFNLFNQGGENILSQNNVEMTMNLEQSILEVFPLETDYISAVTCVNTFNVISLLSCTTKFEFDAKNKNFFSDYILGMNYDTPRHIVQLYCGSFDGIISTVSFDLSKQQVVGKLNGIFYTGFEQSFNSIGFLDNRTFIVVSDKGLIYVLQQNYNSSLPLKDLLGGYNLNNVNKDVSHEKLENPNNKNEDQEMNG